MPHCDRVWLLGRAREVTDLWGTFICGPSGPERANMLGTARRNILGVLDRLKCGNTRNCIDGYANEEDWSLPLIIAEKWYTSFLYAILSVL